MLRGQLSWPRIWIWIRSTIVHGGSVGHTGIDYACIRPVCIYSYVQYIKGAHPTVVPTHPRYCTMTTLRGRR